ncbi:MAG: extracellular solute-binding protein [Clostridiales bacterium]|nr:extracellular solute-binding protein [Clostridiales bacterium]
MKKTLSILLALCLLLGCASAFAENVTISQLGINSYYSTVDLKDAYLLKKIADNAGVSVEWNLLDPGTYAEAVSPMLASGQDLADVIQLPDLDLNQTYLSAGLFEPLDTHFDIMPNYKKFLDENPIIKGSLTAVDGHIYYVPQTVVTNNYQPVLMYNVRWLEKAGIEAPTTLDAFVEMLRYYKENDMNGNGDASDEIPMSIQSAFLPYMFGPAFGLDLVSGFYADDKGVVHYGAYETEAYKAYLTFLNGLYNEGLLEVEFTSLNRDQIVERCANDTTGVTYDFSWQMSTLYSQNAPGYDGEHGIFVGAAPLSGDHAGFYVGRNPVNVAFGINAKSANLETAIKYLDYAMGEEAQDLYVWGEEGLTYEVDEAGNRHFLPRTTEDSTWFQGLGINAPNMPSQQSVPATDVLLAAWHVQNDREFEEPYIRAPFPVVYSTTEEANTLSMYMVDLQTYVDERAVGFISGTYSIEDEFDSYIAALQGLQVEELLKVKQAQYDRFAAAQ